MMKISFLKTTHRISNFSTTLTSHLLQKYQETPATKSHPLAILLAAALQTLPESYAGTGARDIDVNAIVLCLLAAKGSSQAVAAAPSTSATVSSFVRR